MRWLWFVLSVLCFAVAFRTHSMGLAAITLLGALGFLLMGTLALAASRIEASGRDATALIGPDEIARLRAIQQRKQDAPVEDAVADVDGDAVPDHDSTNDGEPRA